MSDNKEVSDLKDIDKSNLVVSVPSIKDTM